MLTKNLESKESTIFSLEFLGRIIEENASDKLMAVDIVGS
jgi:hypothetical protein